MSRPEEVRTRRCSRLAALTEFQYVAEQHGQREPRDPQVPLLLRRAARHERARLRGHGGVQQHLGEVAPVLSGELGPGHACTCITQ